MLAVKCQWAVNGGDVTLVGWVGVQLWLVVGVGGFHGYWLLFAGCFVIYASLLLLLGSCGLLLGSCCHSWMAGTI